MIITQEVAVLKKLQHSNIVKLYDFFQEPNNYMVVLEYLGIYCTFSVVLS